MLQSQVKQPSPHVGQAHVVILHWGKRIPVVGHLGRGMEMVEHSSLTAARLLEKGSIEACLCIRPCLKVSSEYTMSVITSSDADSHVM